ncbi:MAG: hypothetical protein LUD47_04530 [Clostridia bacterium]|nr:hypothetical protein [Clostridia bacterium]
MDRLGLLQKRRKELLDAGADVRGDINEIIDKDSFVELSAFSFHESDFYGDGPEGEGVVTGFATIEGYPYYIVAQNFAVSFGGVTKEACEKICKCLDAAAKSKTPVVYLLSSAGVRVGEGVNVLEGMASLFAKASALKGKVLQYAVVNGEVYGALSVLCGICDFAFFLDKKSFLAYASPAVLSAEKGVGADKSKVASAEALEGTGLVSFFVKSLSEVKDKIEKISSLLSDRVLDETDAALNAPIKELNSRPTAENMLKILDKGSAVEVGGTFLKDVRCFFARVGGVSAAVILFADDEGVKINALKIAKINSFSSLAARLSLPLVTFVNTLGIEESAAEAAGEVYRETARLIETLGAMPAGKISVVYGKAVGLGYTLFSAKSAGCDAVFAFAGARVALFDGAQGAEIEFRNYSVDKEKLAARYADENSDPVNAARGGYIDNIIEPAFAKQYIVAALEMLGR